MKFVEAVLEGLHETNIDRMDKYTEEQRNPDLDYSYEGERY